MREEVAAATPEVQPLLQQLISHRTSGLRRSFVASPADSPRWIEQTMSSLFDMGEDLRLLKGEMNEG